MIDQILPDIPREYTAFAEWLACITYIVLSDRRFGRLTTIGISVGFFVAFLAWHIHAGTMPLALWPVGMLIAVGLMFAYIMLCTTRPTLDTGYLTVRAFVVAELVASLGWQLHTFFLSDTGIRDPVPAFLSIPVPIVATGIIYLLERRQFSPGDRVAATPASLLVALAIGLVTFLMSNISFLTIETPFSATSRAEIFYIRTLIDLAGFVALYAHALQHRELRLATEAAMMETMLRAQQEQYLQTRRSTDAVNRRYHDLKHYLEAFRAEANPATKAEHLDQLEASISGFAQMFNTGNAVLDTILGSKASLCSEQDILLSCRVDGDALDFLEPLDLAVLFGNALDNSIEHLSDMEDRDRRLINVFVRREHHLAVVLVENCMTGTLTLTNGIPVTSKADKERHGYGIRNMREIVERYGGSLTTSTSGGWFELRALIPLPEYAR